MSSVNLPEANTIIAIVLETARAQSLRPKAVVVVDKADHVRVLQREDGASMLRVDIATGKAWAAVGMGASSRVLGERAQTNPNFFVALAATAQGKFLPQTGAVRIQGASGAVIGPTPTASPNQFASVACR